nr:MAG TPA: hypothetical protein [Caudoviricetes sp.]
MILNYNYWFSRVNSIDGCTLIPGDCLILRLPNLKN